MPDDTPEMSEPPKYAYTTFSMSVPFQPPVAVVIRPSWFERVFLRRKPVTVRLDQVMAQRLGVEARRAVERLALQIFRDGRSIP